MTRKINLPVRTFIEQKVSDNFRDIDFRRGTAFNDLFVKVAAMLLQPFRHELNVMKVNQSILNFSNMSSGDIDLLIANYFVNRSSGTKAQGTVRIYFNEPGDFFFNRLFFLTQFGLRFYNVDPIQTSVEGLITNRATDGTYFYDTFVEAERVGAEYSVNAGDISLVQDQPSQIFRVANLEDFAEADNAETNDVLYDKTRRSISVRNLVNDASIKSVLYNQFGFIRDIEVVGAGDSRMNRDLVTIVSEPNFTMHTGGFTDIYIDTTGISSYELNINEVPESLIVEIIPNAQQIEVMDHNTGIINKNLFLDYLHSFYDDGVPRIIRGNILEVTRVEFGQTYIDSYSIEQVLNTNELRISAGKRFSSLDGIFYPDSNFIRDITAGRFIEDINVQSGEFVTTDRTQSNEIEHVFNDLIEVKPKDPIIIFGEIQEFEALSGTTAVVVDDGIGGNVSGTDPDSEVQIEDTFVITTGDSWGFYTVLKRIDGDTVWLARNPDLSGGSLDTSGIDFTGTDTFDSGSTPVTIGRSIIIVSTGETFTVIASGQVDRAHGQGVATVSCYKTDRVVNQDLDEGDQYYVSRAMAKTNVSKTVSSSSAIAGTGGAGGFNFADAVDLGTFNAGDSIIVSGNGDNAGKTLTIDSVDNTAPGKSILVLETVDTEASSESITGDSRFTVTATASLGDFYVEVSDIEVPRLGDIAVINSVDHRVIGVLKGSGVYTIQLDSAITAGLAISDQFKARRFPDDTYAGTVIYNRHLKSHALTSTQAGGSTTISDSDVGREAWFNDIMIIQTGASKGFYTIDSSNPMDPDSIDFSPAIPNDMVVGEEVTISRDVGFLGAGWGDILYVPDYLGSNFTDYIGSFPNSLQNHQIHVTAGQNAGVYDVVEYIDSNRVRLAGTLLLDGPTIVPQGAEFGQFHTKGTNTITETSSPFMNVNTGDTFIIDRAGTIEYYYITSAVDVNNISIFPELKEDIVPGSEQYGVVRGNTIPFIVTDEVKSWEIDKVPELFDRRSEGSDGHAFHTTAQFESPDVDFTQIFPNPADAVGFELYIVEGSHARPEPYIIASIVNTTTLAIDTGATAHDSFFNGAGFIGTTTPANSERWEIKRTTDQLDQLQYRILENYTFYGDDYFNLPLLAIRDIFLIDEATGIVSDTPLEEGVDYELRVKDVGLRYSPIERNYIEFLSEDYAYRSVLIRYYGDPNVQLVQDYANSKGQRITNNNTLVKRMESTFIEVSVSLRGTLSRSDAEGIINEYITTRRSEDVIEASDIISRLYEGGANFVNTDTILLRMIYYPSDGGSPIIESSRNLIGTESQATYIPSIIDVTVIETT